MNQTPLMDKIRMSTNKKVELATKAPAHYIVRAMLAAVFLSLATVASFLVADVMQTFLLAILPASESAANVAYNIAKLFYALVFGWALVMILFMNTELFTSNAMYMTSQVFDKTIKTKPALRVLVLCYVGNFIGAVLIAALLVFSGTFAAGNTAFAAHVVLAKLAKAPMDILLQGIIANMIINTAVILVLRMKEDTAKVMTILGMVFMFAFIGVEHSIANFASFSLVGLATNFAGMSLDVMATNILFSTIGNIIGGGVVIGITYAWLNKGSFKYKD